jgi:glycosyltransferase involved in cell wall biosynthesis
MRIAHIITRMIIGGAQENTLFNCADLIELYGDDVLLITGPALGPEGDLLKQPGAAKVPLRLIDRLRRSIDPRRDLASYGELKAAIRDFRPDVVHTHSAKAGFLGRLAASSLGVKAIVHTVHGAPFHAYQNPLAREVFRWCEWYAARHCHALISVADAMTDLLVEARVAPRDKFTTIYSGMDVEPLLHADDLRAATRAELGYEPHHIVIGKIARLFHLKGHHDLIQAAAEVVRANPNVRFLLVGDGVLRDELQSLIASKGLSDHFRFTGLVPPDRIPALVSAMDILVHTSLREGLPRALVQALLAARPVVAYDIDGAREVAISGQTGYLVPPRGAELVQPLVQLAASSALRHQLGANGRERFTEPFRHQTMTRQIRELYVRLLG